MHDGKYIQIISIRNDQGQEKLIYFDMTDIYRKLGKSRDKKNKERYQKIDRRSQTAGKRASRIRVMDLFRTVELSDNG